MEEMKVINTEMELLKDEVEYLEIKQIFLEGEAEFLNEMIFDQELKRAEISKEQNKLIAQINERTSKTQELENILELKKKEMIIFESRLKSKMNYLSNEPPQPDFLFGRLPPLLPPHLIPPLVEIDPHIWRQQIVFRNRYFNRQFADQIRHGRFHGRRQMNSHFRNGPPPYNFRPMNPFPYYN